ncbi:transmembrane and ubiquitin-like domain-containing protein 1 [Hemicordylus capensis]|uniref:transmembrane and ubiquitin-like domain-containing protein 1 n=1 Tax=Hemicordylus capensis TaxID=884348 RepID=UPI0023031324|nr:transmembrane and ubiquitin-like domain-containing protein 1 [Hemicordylus capensis]XP_053116379.1 transmembrane and ubiquitin-like domain-containing protein 1 [Hemicordylus capensis]
MALIEGVGDEVTILFGLLAVLAVLVLAWFSTHTRERGADPLLATASPPRAAGQLRAEALREDRAAAAPVSGVRQVKEEGEPAGGAGGPGGLSGDLRHRTSPSSPQQPFPPPEGPSAESSPTDNTIVLRLKFLNDTERLARTRPEDTVGALKRAHFPGQEQLVRLIYQGQLLRDDSQTLAALHLTHNSVLHCHVSQHRSPPVPAGGPHGTAAHTDAAHAALNVGSLMVPLFVLMLGALWYFQLQYRHVFTATATTCLAGLTLVFSFVAFTVYRR